MVIDKMCLSQDASTKTAKVTSKILVTNLSGPQAWTAGRVFREAGNCSCGRLHEYRLRGSGQLQGRARSPNWNYSVDGFDYFACVLL
jgi:hypothetical protein